MFHSKIFEYMDSKKLTKRKKQGVFLPKGWFQN